MAWDFAVFGIRSFETLKHPVTGGADHLEIDAELAAVDDFHVGVLSGVGVQHRGDIVFGVSGSKQHAGHGIDAFHTARDQFVEAVADDRGRELQKAMLDFLVCEFFAQGFGHDTEFTHCTFVTTAMATHHDAKIFRHACLLLQAIDHAVHAGPRGGRRIKREPGLRVSIDPTRCRLAGCVHALVP